MKVIGDLHIHSRFSRATSPKLTPSYLDRWARIKGIQLLGTGDCTHPGWLEVLRDELEEDGSGFFKLNEKVRREFDSGSGLSDELPNPCGEPVHFVLTGEISTIYKYGGKTRKVHHVVILPDFKSAAAFQVRLESIGNIRSDGRPILGIDSRDLLAMLLETSEDSILIPAHIWTPWFSALGANSGFDSIQECYRDLSQHIYAAETGLSSNPPMNWALQSLDGFSIVSNSDAHSPDKIGREATIFDMEMNWNSFRNSFLIKDAALPTDTALLTDAPFPTDAAWPTDAALPNILGTIEFFPQEGKYHYDGHRACKVSMGPEEAAERGGICPVCGKKFTPGVMSRVLSLADRNVDETAVFTAGGRPNQKPYYSLIPLREILGELLKTGAASKKVESAYRILIEKAGSEFNILMDLPIEEIRNSSPVENLAQAVDLMRRGDVFISPGYDGEYGVIRTMAAGQNDAGLFGNDGLGFGNDGFGNGGLLYDSFNNIKSKNFKAHGQKIRKIKNSDPVIAEAAQKPVNNNALFRPDANQSKIIESNAKTCLIIAGPGAGKTAVLAAKIAALVCGGADPQSILALSFTVKAADELRARISRLLPQPSSVVQPSSVTQPSSAAAPAVSTFHSFCASVLRAQYKTAGLLVNFKIISEAQRKELLEKLCAVKSGKNSGRAIQPANLGNYIEEHKRFLLLPGEKAEDLARVLPASLHSLIGEFVPKDLDAVETAALDTAVPETSVSETSVWETGVKYQALYSEYRNTLREGGFVDYDGLIAGTVRLLALRKDILDYYRSKLRFIFIDEYQDLNFAQYVLARLLAPESENSASPGENAASRNENAASLWVIGDPNQAIYGFRGSDKAFIDRFLFDYPRAQKFELLKSFRCRQPIIEAAGKLAGVNLEGIKTAESGAVPVSLYRREYSTEKSEAEGIARTIASLAGGTSFFSKDSGVASDGEKNFSLQECAVLVRAAFLAEPVIKALKDHGIPFELPDAAPWWQEEPAASILKYLEENFLRADGNRADGNASAESAADEIAGAWKTLTSKGQFSAAETDAAGEAVVRLLYLTKVFGNTRALLDGLSVSSAGDAGSGGLGIIGPSQGVRVMTIHASKGLEFDHVFIPGLEEGIIPFTLYDRKNSEENIAEERRILYVAMTRARRGLWLSRVGSRFLRGRVLKSQPSRFLSGLENIIPLLDEEKHYRRDPQMTLF